MKKALVCGAGPVECSPQQCRRRQSFLFHRAGGFIGGHLVKKLKREGYWVRGVDIKEHEFAETPALWNTSIDSAGDIRTSYSTGQADEFRLLDLREPHNCWEALNLNPRHSEPVEESRRTFNEVYQLAADMGGMGFIHNAESRCASLFHSLGG